MNVTMNFHQLESTPSIKEMVEKKSQKLKKFVDGSCHLKWTLSAGKDGHHSHVLLASDGLTLNAESTKDDLYKTFDDVISKLEKQLLKKKNITKDHIHHKHDRTHINLDEPEEEEV